MHGGCRTPERSAASAASTASTARHSERGRICRRLLPRAGLDRDPGLDLPDRLQLLPGRGDRPGRLQARARRQRLEPGAGAAMGEAVPRWRSSRWRRSTGRRERGGRQSRSNRLAGAARAMLSVRRPRRPECFPRFGPRGEVAEWSIAPHSKCGVRASVPGVRIPSLSASIHS